MFYWCLPSVVISTSLMLILYMPSQESKKVRKSFVGIVVIKAEKIQNMGQPLGWPDHERKIFLLMASQSKCHPGQDAILWFLIPKLLILLNLEINVYYCRTSVTTRTRGAKEFFNVVMNRGGYIRVMFSVHYVSKFLCNSDVFKLEA